MAEPNTNRAALPDFNSFFKNQGRAKGYQPTDAEMDLARAVLVPVTKELMMRQFAPPEGAIALGTRTNPVTKFVAETEEYPDGSFKTYRPDRITTVDGFQEIIGPGTSRNITNVDTGGRAMGYLNPDSMYGEQPVVGAQPAATPAATPTAAMKPYSMTNAEGTAMTFSNPYDVRAALRRGELTQDEAVAATLHFRRP